MLIPPLSEVLFLFVTNDRAILVLVFRGDARENRNVRYHRVKDDFDIMALLISGSPPYS